MRVGELHAVMKHLQKVYLAAGAKGPAKDIEAIASILQTHPNALVADFVADLSERLIRSSQKNKSSRKPSKSAQPIALNETVIVSHVANLHEAGTQQVRFDHALEQINSDSRLNLADMSEIARRYTNSVTKYRSLAAARKAITQAFVRRARFENKLR